MDKARMMEYALGALLVLVIVIMVTFAIGYVIGESGSSEDMCGCGDGCSPDMDPAIKYLRDHKGNDCDNKPTQLSVIEERALLQREEPIPEDDEDYDMYHDMYEYDEASLN